MLVVRGKIEIGDLVYTSMLAFERRFRVYLEERRDTIWDTRFVRPRSPKGGGRPVVFVLLDGWHEWHAQPKGGVVAPAVFVASQDVVDGLRGDTFARTTGGNPCRILQLRLTDGPDVSDERPRPLENASAIIDAAQAISASSDDDLRRPITTLLEACADAGVVPRGLAETMTAVESRNITRLWAAVRARHLLMERFPALDQVADFAGFSARHAARALDEIFAAFNLEWSGWRDAINDMRLRWVVMLLSSRSVSISEVAHSAGYGSVNALGTALRKAGLPGPREVRSAILLREEERVARYMQL